jgi:hypothetical protein
MGNASGGDGILRIEKLPLGSYCISAMLPFLVIVLPV